MADDRRSFRALAKLVPTGVLGLSMASAAAGAQATSSMGPAPAPSSVAAKLKAIRSSVSDAVTDPTQENADNPLQLAWWGNGWHNGGWGNGWHNGGWGNGWGNGGWHNWGNGWHNGWHNW